MNEITLSYRFPPISEDRFDNGLTVLWVPDREQAGVTVAVQFPVGKFSDSVGREGTAELAVGLVQKGTEELTSEQIARKLEHVGASVFSDVGDEHTLVGCRFLDRFLPTVLPLFLDLLMRPKFRTPELKRLKREMLTSVQAENNDPGSLASRHFYAQLCGPGHPAGRTHTARSLKAIGIADVEAFFRAFLHAGHAVLVIAGDIDPVALRSQYRAVFSGWRTGTGAAPVRAAALGFLRETRIRLIDKTDVSQAYLILGHPVPGEMHESRNALAVANYILGGGNFSSRLMTSIRTKVGKTYSIGSQILCDHLFGVFSITTSTQTSQFADVLRSTVESYRDLGRSGVTEDELETAKQYAIGSMAFQLEGIGNVVEKLLWLRLFGRDTSYIEEMAQTIRAISRERINRAIQEHFSPPGLVITVVGRKSEILPELRKYGPVRLFTPRSRV